MTVVRLGWRYYIEAAVILVAIAALVFTLIVLSFAPVLFRP